MELEVSHTPENFLYFIFLETTILEMIKNVPYLGGYVYPLLIGILMFNVNKENT